MKPTSTLRNFLLASASLAAVSTVYAQTWDGSDNTSWNDPDNWSSNSVPGSGAAIVFDGTGTNLATNFNGTSFTLNSLTFTSGQTAAVNITTTYLNPLTFNPGTVLSVAAGDHKFIGSNTTASSGTRRDMLFTGTSALDTYTFDIASGASFEINGRIKESGTGAASRTYTKSGTGTLILSGNSGGSGTWLNGGFQINQGVLRLASAGALGSSASKYTVASGAALEFTGGITSNYSNAAHTISGTGIGGTGALRSLSGTNSLTGGGSGSITLGADSSIGVDADELTIAMNITDGVNDYSLTKVGAGTLALTGTNTYSGATIISGGILNLGNSLALQDSALDTAASVAGGAATGLKTTVTTLTLGGLTGNKDFASVFTSISGGYDTVTALTLNPASGSITYSGAITDGAAGMSLTKTGAGTQTLSGLSGTAANNYSGTTTIGAGTLAFTTNSASLTGGLTFGATAGSTITGALDLSDASAAFDGNFVVRTNSATANTISIGSGQSLAVDGNFTVGFNSSSNTITNLTASGLGELEITSGNFQIGATNTDNRGNAATLDMSGLATFTYDNASGNFRVGPAGGTSNVNTGDNTATVILADTSTITASLVSTDTNGRSPTTIRLGSVENIINADTINIGLTNGRVQNSSLIFDTANGTLKVRDTSGLDVTGRANMTVGYGGATTTLANASNVVDLTGHSADLLLADLQIAGRIANGNATTATFSFDQGTLDVTGVTVGARGGSGTGTSAGLVDGTLNLGGGNVDIRASGLTVATNTATTSENTLNAAVNISGGTVDIGQTGGTSVTLGSSADAGAGATTAALNLTSTGNLTVAGDIVKGTSVGAVTSTLALNGASAILDMGGNDITGLTGITYTAGTLKNLGTVNTGMTMAGTGSRVFDQATGVNGEIQGEISGSGIGLTKQGDGKLTLSGTSTYDGATSVSAGTLFVTGSLSSDVTVSDDATVGGGGTVGAISFAGGSFFDIFLAVDSADSLASTTISFAATGFGIDNLVSNGAAVNWGSVANGTYTLITGTLDETNLGNFGLANAYNLGSGRSAYFSEGSLQLVVIPEPRAALLGGLGLLALLRRRR